MQYYNALYGVYTKTQADDQFLTVNLSGASSASSPAALTAKTNNTVETTPFYTKEVDSKTFAGQEFTLSNPIEAGNIICIKILKDGTGFVTTTVFDGLEQNVAIRVSDGIDNASDLCITCTIGSTKVSFGKISNKNNTSSSELEALFSGVIISILRFSFI